MTREEKINQLNDIFAEINEDDNAVCYLTSEDNELIESAIKALEQECEDAISRKAVTDTSICEGISCDECSFGKDFEYGFSECQLKKRVDALPSVQPKPIECEDAISREAAIDAIKEIHPIDTEYDCTLYDKVDVMYVLEDLPSVQPKYNASEWCRTCSEYDHDKHCCPRYNKVIRSAVEEIKQCEEAISREEAIGAVANLFEMSEYPHPYPQGKPIRLKDIKEKLKQLPPVQPKQIECEDAISRQATIDTLWAERKELDSCMQKCLENNQMSLRVLIKAERNRIEEDIYIINNLPPVTPQPKIGHWIVQPSNKEQGERDFIWWKCSECGQVIFSETEKDRREYHAFCGRCGARMVEPQESEET